MQINQGKQDEIETIEQIKTPDVRGMKIEEAEKILKENGLILSIEGNNEEEIDKENTIIKEQTPSAGIIINKGNKVYVRK